MTVSDELSPAGQAMAFLATRLAIFAEGIVFATGYNTILGVGQACLACRDKTRALVHGGGNGSGISIRWMFTLHGIIYRISVKNSVWKTCDGVGGGREGRTDGRER